jgi:hypothetical protein
MFLLQTEELLFQASTFSSFKKLCFESWFWLVNQEFHAWKFNNAWLEKLQAAYIIGAVVVRNFDFADKFDYNRG